MEALGYCARKRSQADEVRSQKLEARAQNGEREAGGEVKSHKPKAKAQNEDGKEAR